MERFTNGKAASAVAPLGLTLAFGNVITTVLQYGLGWELSPQAALSFGIVALFIINRFFGDVN